MINLLVSVLAGVGIFIVFLSLLVVWCGVLEKMEYLKEEEAREFRKRIERERKRLIGLERRGFKK